MVCLSLYCRYLLVWGELRCWHLGLFRCLLSPFTVSSTNDISYLSLKFGARVAQWVRSLDLTTRTSLSPIRRGFAPSFVNYKKGCTLLTVTSDKVYQLLAHGRWCTTASSTTKSDRHDIADSCVIKHQHSNSLKFAQPSGFVTLNLKICFSLCFPIGLVFNSQPLTWFKTFLRLSGFVPLWYYVYDSNHKQVWELKKQALYSVTISTVVYPIRNGHFKMADCKSSKR
jgi:hypothetical protein